jgi:hypothetical protein
MIKSARMTHEEIEKAVFEKYPKLPIERTCATERIMRAAAREAYRKKLNDKAAVQREAYKEDEQI